MLFAVGTKVELIHSKDEATVTALLDDGMVMVRILLKRRLDTEYPGKNSPVTN